MRLREARCVGTRLDFVPAFFAAKLSDVLQDALLLHNLLAEQRLGERKLGHCTGTHCCAGARLRSLHETQEAPQNAT